MTAPMSACPIPPRPICWHILNGDALVAHLPADLDGEIIIWREALMDGPISASPDEFFWVQRAEYIAKHLDASPETYRAAFMTQLERIGKITPADEAVFWFEDDLFCQVNLWMAVLLVNARHPARMSRVFPSAVHGQWSGFGPMDGKEAAVHFERRVTIDPGNVVLMHDLLAAYADGDEDRLRKLAGRPTGSMRHLPEVIGAHLLRSDPDPEKRMPDALLRRLMREGHSSFEDLFASFLALAGVYGYGDTQIRARLRAMGFPPC